MNNGFKIRKIIDSIKFKNRFIPSDEHILFLRRLITYADSHSSIIIEEGTSLYRTRPIPFGFDIIDCHRPEEMLAPPPEKCMRGGRLNPAGIPYLYCAFEQETAIAEQRPSIGASFSLATLKTNKKISVIDTNNTNLIYARDEYGFIDVLNYIGDLFSKPIHQEDPVGYAPTQYLAEMFKSTGTSGIKYKSAMNRNGFNLVIFDQKLVDVIFVERKNVANIKIYYSNGPRRGDPMPTYSEPSGC